MINFAPVVKIMKNVKPNILLVAGAILAAALFRLVPHWPNFTPIGAIALMGGALITNRFAGAMIPMLAMLISDYLTVVLINFAWTTPAEYFSSPQTAFVYLGVLSNVLVGYLLGSSSIRKEGFSLTSGRFSTSLLGASLISAILFFLISNFGTWASGLTPGNPSLLAVYALGVPFFGYSLLANVFYSFLFFGLFQLLCERYPLLREASVRS